MGAVVLSRPDSASVHARVATALATASAVWCLAAAHLLAPQTAAAVVTLLLIAEAVAATWPVPARRVWLPASLAGFGLIAVERVREVTVTDVASARPLGAFLTAGAMIVVALAGDRRRDLFARLGLLLAATGLALTVGAREAMLPAVAVGLATGAALVALERALLTTAPTEAQSRRPPPPLARTRLIAVPLAVTAALTGLIAGNASLSNHHPQATVGGATVGAGSASESATAQSRLDPAGSAMDLRQRGPLSNRAVARITPFNDDRSPHLWRASVMEGYDGTRWYPAEDPERVAATGEKIVDQVTALASDRLPLLTPGTATGLSTSDSSYDDPPFPQTVVAGWYQVTSVIPIASENALATTPKAAGPQDEGPVDPPNVPARVLELARQLTAQSATRQQAVHAVVAYLHSHETYQLDSPVPAKGEDAVDDFLFRSHTGFCEQFASAAAVLLQASGVPTRVVVGYASGQQDPRDGSWLVRGSDAHAWIEVYYPRAGWLPVDPTAGVPLARGGSGSNWQPLAVAAGVLLIVGLFAGGFAAVRRRRARRTDPLRHSLTALDAALGSARRQPSESLRDLAARVPLSASERAALNTAERAFYGKSPLAAAELSTAAATMRRTARRVRRERLIPRRRRPIG